MAVIIPNKLIYLAHPRTASKATSVTLGQIDSAFTEPRHHRHLYNLEYERQGELVVTTIRHHGDALVSWWLHHGQRNGYGETLSEFTRFLLEFPHEGFWLVPTPGRLWDLHLPWCNCFMRFESLQEDLNWVLERVGWEPRKLLRVNQTRGKREWGSYYNAERQRIVEDTFGGEMQELGYQF